MQVVDFWKYDLQNVNFKELPVGFQRALRYFVGLSTLFELIGWWRSGRYDETIITSFKNASIWEG
jgi:hypothetical protein